ncbi:MAG: hypothetical protein A2161_05630 [Candidatus Schekmanbacteria bacterium RBG_13_48_7]|uniref:MotA/TolQ/ExbB proton channel domain-containing protein n=1 Tax=Candidatus Schekmanbacteria bacterium RBG_13_48_7 TaxID=1817878 RepID=A0A1F7S4M4_9BACT|nr:MAG: hypothetical protein A2161_05630 [Candidatus Schekmanbacteria bacterium RBG_13_48_7]
MGSVFNHIVATTAGISVVPIGIFKSDMLNLIANLGMIARVVLLILLLFSVISWGIILQKLFYFKSLNHFSEKFIKIFNNYGSIQELAAAAQKFRHSPLSKIFFAAYTEIQHFRSPNNPAGSSISLQNPNQLSMILDSISRTMRNASMLERNRLEKYVIFLATTGGVTPFIGLFGTVWGIMNAFRSISSQSTVNIATVAPGIAEALIATAVGLFAAIPGVIAFNYFQRKIQVFIMEFEYFSTDVLNYLQHHYFFFGSNNKSATGDQSDENR